MNTKQLTDTDFYQKYNPEFNQVILSKLTNKGDIENATSFGGCMYETFGEEVEYLKKIPNNRIWTIIDEDGEMFIIAGYHFVNRLGYLVTKEEWSDCWENYLVD